MNAITVRYLKRDRARLLLLQVSPLILRGSVALATCAIPVSYARAMHAEESAAMTVVLVVENLDSIDPEQLRAAVAAELGVTVVLAAPGGGGTLLVRGSNSQVTVTFEVGGSIVGRKLDLPRDPTVLLETVASVSGSLVRDETTGFLGSIRRADNSAPGAKQAAVASGPAAKPVGIDRAPWPAPTVFSPCDSTRPRTNIGVDFVPKLGSSMFDSDKYRAFSMGVIGTTSAGLRGVEIASLFTHTSEDMCGAQIAGVANIVGDRVHGVQTSVVINTAPVSVYGAQITGVTNVGGEINGAQIAGVANVGSKIEGVQIAGVVNVASGPVRGAQIGVVNIAWDDVHGTQIGVVNVARDSDASIGLFSFGARGRTTIDAWGTESGFLMLGVEHGGRVLHTLWGVGERLGADANRFVVAVGLGGRAISTDRLTLDIDIISHWFIPKNWHDKETLLYQARLLLGWRLARGFTLMCGPTYSAMVTWDPKESSQSPVGTRTWTDENASTRVLSWPGITLGVRLL